MASLDPVAGPKVAMIFVFRSNLGETLTARLCAA